MSSLLLTDTVAHRARGARAGRRVVVPLAEYRAARAGHPVALRRPTGPAPGGSAVSGDAFAGAPGEACADESYAGEGYPDDASAGESYAGEAPLRLTRRGRVVVRLLGGAGLLLVVAVGMLGGPSALAGPEAERVPVAERVVLPGETLWGIAGEVAPGADRRETVAQIMELNGLPSAEVAAGRRLSVPAGAP